MVSKCGSAIKLPGSSMRNQDGFSLMELLVTIVILGFVAYSFSTMQMHILYASVEEDDLFNAARLVENRMEETINLGVGTKTTKWIKSGEYEWKRTVTVLKKFGKNPTLVEVRIQVRKGKEQLCSLITHIVD